MFGWGCRYCRHSSKNFAAAWHFSHNQAQICVNNEPVNRALQAMETLGAFWPVIRQSITCLNRTIKSCYRLPTVSQVKWWKTTKTIRKGGIESGAAFAGRVGVRLPQERYKLIRGLTLRVRLSRGDCAPSVMPYGTIWITISRVLQVVERPVRLPLDRCISHATMSLVWCFVVPSHHTPNFTI